MKIFLIGKGASGKTYVENCLKSMGFKCGIFTTTRSIRDGEQEGVNYYYKTDKEFLENKNLYICSNSYNNWYYGLTYDEFTNKDIFIMTPMYIKQLKEQGIDLSNIYKIYFDIDFITRQNRLLQRNDADSVDRRLLADEEDFIGFVDYDISFKNFNLSDILQLIQSKLK